MDTAFNQLSSHGNISDREHSINKTVCLIICLKCVPLIFVIYFAVNILRRNEVFLHFSNISRAKI